MHFLYHFCLYLSFLHIYILHLVRKYFPVSETKLVSKALSPAKAHSRASGACLATAGVKRRLLATSALYAAVRILVERFLRYVTEKQFPVTKKQMTDTVSSVICFVLFKHLYCHLVTDELIAEPYHGVIFPGSEYALFDEPRPRIAICLIGGRQRSIRGNRIIVGSRKRNDHR